MLLENNSFYTSTITIFILFTVTYVAQQYNSLLRIHGNSSCANTPKEFRSAYICCPLCGRIWPDDAQNLHPFMLLDVKGTKKQLHLI